MRFIHLSDLHLGKVVNGYSMIEDQERILNLIINFAHKYRVDAIVVAGDIYDKGVPTTEAVNLLDSFLYNASKKGIYLYMISGNHDSADRLNFGTSHFRKDNIFLSGRFENKMDKYSYRDAYGKVNFYLLPYVKASTVRYYYPDEDIETYEDALRVVMEHADVDETERNVIIAHQYVTGEKSDPSVSGSETVRPESVGTIEKISYEVFDRFDYAALGHIHSPQKIGRETVRYSGSPLKYSLREVDSRKSFPVVTLGKKGDVKIDLVKIKPKRDIRHLTGPIDEIIENAEDTEDYIYVTLTDEMAVPDAMSRIKAVYPNTMHVDYLKRDEYNPGEMEFEDPFEKRSFRQLISGFYESMYDREMSDEEWKIISELSEKAGIEK